LRSSPGEAAYAKLAAFFKDRLSQSDVDEVMGLIGQLLDATAPDDGNGKGAPSAWVHHARVTKWRPIMERILASQITLDKLSHQYCNGTRTR
jgi:hypothetical protein